MSVVSVLASQGPQHHVLEQVVEVNGRTAALLWFGRQYQLLAVEVRAGKIREVHSMMNPDKLEYLRRQVAGQQAG